MSHSLPVPGRLPGSTPARRARRRIALAAALAGGLAVSLLVGVTHAAVPANLATLEPSTFEIDNDANLKNDNDPPPRDPEDRAPTWVDWADLAHGPSGQPEVRVTDALTGQGDDSYKGGVKEDTDCPGETTGSIPNNKSDLLTFHTYTEAGVGTHPGFLNLAWSRVSDPSGTTLMDFEFNRGSLQNADDLCSNSPNVKRSEGDLLLEYAITQGGARANITLRTWNATAKAWRAARDLDDPNNTDCGGGPCAVGTINSSAIPFGESDGLISSGSKSARTFGEAQIDLRTIFRTDECTSFGTAMLKSRSSDSFTSQLKDFIRPASINLTNCGQVIIRKVTDPAGSSQSFGFTKAFTTSPATGNTFSLTGVAANNANVKTFDNVLFGTGYTVTEDALPTGWTLQGIDCNASVGVSPTVDVPNRKVTFDIDSASDLLDCTYTNRARGSLTIVKKDDAGANLAGAVFTLYHNNAPTAGPRGVEDTVTNPALTCTAAANGQCTISNIPLGSYWVVETTTPAGHATAADQAVEVTAGSTQTLNFENPRLFKVIVLVCKESDNSLYSSNVTLPANSADADDTKASLGSSANPTAAQLCGLGGASFGGLQKGEKQVKVNIGTNALP